MNQVDVMVVGAGAAGLFCALTAGYRGRSVQVLDSSNKAGKKILMSGGGRCNFTNLDITPQNYLSNNPHFCISALNRFSQWQFIDMVERHGIPYHERKHGELFCDDSAKDILAMLLTECDWAGVKVQLNCAITAVAAQADGGYTLRTSTGDYRCRSLVVATGGLSIPTMGASGFGYELAEQFGMRVLPRRAGLAPFTFSDAFKACTDHLSGLAVDVDMSLGEVSFRENMLFTHRGLSGPAALQLSNYWLPGQAIAVNLLPDVDVTTLLSEHKASRPRALLRTLLSEPLPRSLTVVLQDMLWPRHAETPIAEWPNAMLREVAQHLCAWRLKPSGTEGYRTAEVTLGGVDTDGLSSKTMASRQHPGLFFVGEVVDVTGHLGGYNFQWAWSSGYAAGCAV